MKKTEATTTTPPAFGEVDMNAEHGIFSIDTGRGRTCRLTLIGHTERGFPRRELATIRGKTWTEIALAVQKELVRGMEGRGESKQVPTLVAGDNALSPLMVRELAVLLWALMEDEEGKHTDAFVSGWKQLACEERWWLYARASGPAQRLGQGWRRALFFALNDPADTRTNKETSTILNRRDNEDEAASPIAKKKSPATTRPRSNGSVGTVKPKRAAKKSRIAQGTPRATATKKSQPEASARPQKKPATRKSA